MSLYYRYNFVSPEPIFARVKEDLQSYFDTGIVDDLLFPKHVEYCLKKMGRVSYKIAEAPVFITDGQGTLPDDFVAVKELFNCLTISPNFSVNVPSADYRQVTSQLTPYLDSCQDCVLKDEVVTTKDTLQVKFTYRLGKLMKPATISAIKACADDCGNLYSSSADSFDVHGNKVLVNFSDGLVHLVYYKEERDENEFQLIPDIVEFTDYLEHYIKFKCFETIFNKVTDESFNQVYEKYKLYKQEQGIKQVISLTEFRKRSIYDIKRSIMKSYKALDHYDRMLWNNGRRLPGLW